MRATRAVLVMLMLAGLIAAGCNKNANSTATVNTAPVENSFKSADPATQSSAQKAVSAVKAGDYSTALSELKTLASNTKLTPEQQQAVKDVMAQVQQALTKTASDIQSGASKAASDLKNSLPK